jgi:hypothetical protein
VVNTVTEHATSFYESATYTENFGSALPSAKTKDLVQFYLREMEVPYWYMVRIHSTDTISVSTSWHVWIEEHNPFGPKEFVTAHEAAHVALRHFDQRGPTTTSAEMCAQEVDADLLACETLHKTGNVDIVFERLAHCTLAANMKWKETDLDDHPSLAQIIAFTTTFLENKGYTDVKKQIDRRLPAVRKRFAIA